MPTDLPGGPYMSSNEVRRQRVRRGVLSRLGLFALLLAGAPACLAQFGFSCQSGAQGGSNPSTSGSVPCGNSDSGASASDSPAYYEYTNAAGNAAVLNNTYLIAGNSDATSVWSNQFTVHGPTGVAPLQFQIKMVITGIPTSSECLTNNNQAVLKAQLYYGGEGSINTMGYTGGVVGLGYFSGSCGGTQYNETTGIITIDPGQYFNANTSLNVSASAFAGYTESPAGVPFVENGSAGISGASAVLPEHPRRASRLPMTPSPTL